MTDAPERIWAVTEPDDVSADILGSVYAQQTPDGMVGRPVEYRRADLLPKVKPLEWECTDWSAGDGVRGENDCEWAAQVWPLTNYIISWFGGGRFEINTPTDETLKASSLEAAKAAAQADYKKRILSALDWPLTASDKTRAS